MYYIKLYYNKLVDIYWEWRTGHYHATGKYMKKNTWYYHLFVGWWIGVGFMIAYNVVAGLGKLGLILFSMVMTPG